MAVNNLWTYGLEINNVVTSEWITRFINSNFVIYNLFNFTAYLDLDTDKKNLIQEFEDAKNSTAGLKVRLSAYFLRLLIICVAMY